MNIRSLIQIAVVVGTIAIGTGQLPKILQKVRSAQIVLIQESRTETWGKAMLLPVSKKGSQCYFQFPFVSTHFGQLA